MNLQPIFRERPLRDGISDVLREQIVSGRLKPGQRLKEQELCDELAVSRTALREAFPRLEVECLIINGRDGRTVVEVRPDHIRPLRDTTIALSSLILQEFCKAAGKEGLTVLRDVIARAGPRPSRADERAVLTLLGCSCGNRFAAEMSRQLEDRREMIERFLIGDNEHPSGRREYLENLLIALERQDCRAAIALRSKFLTALFGRLEARLSVVQQPSPLQRLTTGG